MKILGIGLFLAGFGYNYWLKSKMTIFIKQRPLVQWILIAYAVLAFYMAYQWGSTIQDYVLAGSSVLLLYSLAFFQGINKDSVLVFLGTTSLLKRIKASEMDHILLEEVSDKTTYRLKIVAFGEEFTQFYQRDHLEKEGAFTKEVTELLAAVKHQ